MLDLDHPDDDAMRARIAEVEANRIPMHEVLGWFAPWVVAAILVVVCLGALWCASRASDDLTYWIGMAGALLALVALIWEANAALSGNIGNLSLQVLVDDEISLIVLMVLLGLLAIGGLMLAAHGPSPTANGVGYGLCIFGIVFAFANIKHYFDRVEAHD
jgi:Kef-type K+ transport system membrane component KefB